ncbi:hypothetical protein LTR36_003994 [Oleoguttula mirabilis]|uniref:Alpha-ketoglutarate-dependent dioxygenase AlkB-like domain-containing protein n=1 Tax=Oleoguttula mirabilis TaxID=1507867 RepID=A0AAV9JIG2_9PEZI|nr:hypothetical protein LTR36_003994 [Oleoguttula mirabilis]
MSLRLAFKRSLADQKPQSLLVPDQDDSGTSGASQKKKAVMANAIAKRKRDSASSDRATITESKRAKTTRAVTPRASSKPPGQNARAKKVVNAQAQDGEDANVAAASEAATENSLRGNGPVDADATHASIKDDNNGSQRPAPASSSSLATLPVEPAHADRAVLDTSKAGLEIFQIDDVETAGLEASTEPLAHDLAETTTPSIDTAAATAADINAEPMDVRANIEQDVAMPEAAAELSPQKELMVEGQEAIAAEVQLVGRGHADQVGPQHAEIEDVERASPEAVVEPLTNDRADAAVLGVEPSLENPEDTAAGLEYSSHQGLDETEHEAVRTEAAYKLSSQTSLTKETESVIKPTDEPASPEGSYAAPLAAEEVPAASRMHSVAPTLPLLSTAIASPPAAESAPSPTSQLPALSTDPGHTILRFELERDLHDLILGQINPRPTVSPTNPRSPVYPIAPPMETSQHTSSHRSRRSDHARRAPSPYQGMVKTLPTEADLDTQVAGAQEEEEEEEEEEEDLTPSTRKAKTKKATARKTSTRPRKAKAPLAKSAPRERKSSQISDTPKTPRNKEASGITKTPRTPKAPAKAMCTISTADRPELSDYVSSAFVDGPALKKGAARRSPPTPPSSQGTQIEAEALPEINVQLLVLSKALTHREPLGSKPEPQGQPLVWADSRQALCETVPYFKKPQGGCHQNDRHVYSFLFDGVGHCREYMDSDVIVARAGGSMESDSSSGGMLQGKDQSMTDSQVLAMLNDIGLQNPLIVICGDRNTGAPSKMPHKYCVLGWFKPIAVWAEKTAGKGKKSWITVKYRLERLNSAEPAWHAPTAARTPESTPEAAGAGLLQAHTCTNCTKRWPQIYLMSWMCLNPACAAFWKLASGVDAPSGTLDYNPAFLLARTPWHVEAEPFSVKPPLPDVGKAIGDNLLYVNTRGICCPDCGRCNHRYKFSGWVCDNPECLWEGLPANHQPILPVSLHQPWDSFGDGPSLARNKHETGVSVEILYTHGYKVYRYTFAGIEGSFTHAVANNRINGEQGGPDNMLAAIQIEDMGLERRRFNNEKMSSNKVEKVPRTPLRPSTDQAQLLTPPSEVPTITDGAEAIRGVDDQVASPLRPPTDQPQLLTPPSEVLTITDGAEAIGGVDGQIQEQAIDEHVPEQGVDEHVPKQDIDEQLPKPEAEAGDFMTAFSMNYGMPYKFVASGASKSFQEAPWPVRACRSRLNWAQKTFLPDRAGDVDFNEQLIFAYMEGQKIEYHDDGEEGLGSRIATLSLGGKAKMHLRLKMKHFVGCSKTGLLTIDDRPPVPGGIGGKEMDGKRRAAWDELQVIKNTDRPLYQKRLKEIPKELGLYEKRMKKADDLVTVTLGHGDIILMEGYDIQKHLEHKVVPEGYLRFALTCRTVLENHLKPEERPQYPVTPDDYGYDGSNLL